MGAPLPGIPFVEQLGPIEVSLDDARHFLGAHPDGPSDGWEDRLVAARDQVLAMAAPRASWVWLPVEKTGPGRYRVCSEAEDLVICDADDHLDGCPVAIVYALTLGVQLDHLLRAVQISDLPTALAMDAVATALLFAADAALLDRLAHADHARGRCFLGPWFPGDGGLVLENQALFCRLTDARRKLSLSVLPSSFALQPLKSLCGLLAVGEAGEGREGSEGSEEGEGGEADDGGEGSDGIGSMSVEERSAHRCETCLSRNNCLYRRRTPVTDEP